MKRSLLLSIVCLVICALPDQTGAQLPYPIPHPESYVCYQLTDSLIIDGKLSEVSWEKAAWSMPFVDIEGSLKPAPYLNTRVKMLWDSTCFYFAAEMEEPHLWATLQQRDTVIFYDNDIEIFIDPDGDSHGYYELEMNAFNTLWDLLLPKPYREGGPAIDHWDINGIQSGVALYGTINDPSDTDQKWTVEVAIPWEVLEEYAAHSGPPKSGEQWRISYSRVHYDLELVDGKYQKKKDEMGNPLPEYNWTWTPQWVINMHRPETWGYVQFEAIKVGSKTLPFRIDTDFNLKMALYEIYLAQKAHKKQFGAFAEWPNLDISEFNKMRFLSDLQMEMISDKFIIRGSGRKGIYQIDETGLLKLLH
ncbi:MAG: carbohydrate-binding family 9-like protein [Bacteroidetes bacterium]|nr:carbohydrate-binding family 9-like protein [Bacteroidota bacterium]